MTANTYTDSIDIIAESALPGANSLPTQITQSVAVPAPFTSTYASQRVSFWGILRSEWLKLWTLRSTWWVVCLTIFLMAGFALLFAWIMRTTLNDPNAMAAMVAAGEASGGEAMGADMGAMFAGGLSTVTIVTLGLQFAQLTVAVLGVLMITNEYSSGMIRATLSAAPSRSSVLVAKLLVLLATTALMTVIGLVLAWLTARPILADVELINPINFASSEDVRALIGSVLYLIAIAALSLGLGSLIRATAGGIFAVVALLMVLPMIFQIILLASDASWAKTLNRFLPTVAGERIYAVGEFGSGMSTGMGSLTGEMLSPWAGFFVLLAYAAIAFSAALFAMHRRDA